MALTEHVRVSRYRFNARELNSYTADGKPVVLIVVVRGVDASTIEVQVVRVGSRVLRRRPVVAVAALIVEPIVPVATPLRQPLAAQVTTRLMSAFFARGLAKPPLCVEAP